MNMELFSVYTIIWILDLEPSLYKFKQYKFQIKKNANAAVGDQNIS